MVVPSEHGKRSVLSTGRTSSVNTRKRRKIFTSDMMETRVSTNANLLARNTLERSSPFRSGSLPPGMLHVHAMTGLFKHAGRQSCAAPQVVLQAQPEQNALGRHEDDDGVGVDALTAQVHDHDGDLDAQKPQCSVPALSSCCACSAAAHVWRYAHAESTAHWSTDSHAKTSTADLVAVCQEVDDVLSVQPAPPAKLGEGVVLCTHQQQASG